MNFLALSQAPPPLLSTVAMRMPPIVPMISVPETASQPDASCAVYVTAVERRHARYRGGCSGR